MKPKLLFTIASIYFILGGIGQMIAPALNFYLDASSVSAYSINVFRATTGLLMGLGVVYWFVRDAEASKARDALFLGSSIGFLINTIFVVLAALTPDGVALTWIIAAINLLFALGFFLVGRANMSTSAS